MFGKTTVDNPRFIKLVGLGHASGVFTCSTFYVDSLSNSNNQSINMAPSHLFFQHSKESSLILLFKGYVRLIKPLFATEMLGLIDTLAFTINTSTYWTVLSNSFFEARPMAAVIVFAVNVLLIEQFSITDICDRS